MVVSEDQHILCACEGRGDGKLTVETTPAGPFKQSIIHQHFFKIMSRVSDALRGLAVSRVRSVSESGQITGE